MADAVIGSLTSSDFTIECAFKITVGTLNMHLMSKSSNNIEYSIRLDTVTSTILKLDLFESDNTDRSVTICDDLDAIGATVGTWAYLSIRMDRTGTGLLSCKINNVPAIAPIDVSTWGTAWRTDVLSKFCLGADEKDGTEVWNGSIDRVAIYLKAITDSERDNNYNWWNDLSGEPPASGGPTDYVAYWSMDNTEVVGATLLDLSGNDHTATMVNTPTTGQTGQVAEAVLFASASSEYATIVNDPVLRPTQLTISLWVKPTSLNTCAMFNSFNQTTANNVDRWGFSLIYYSDGSVSFVTFDADTQDSTNSGASTLAIGQWTHVLGTFDGTNKRLYIDGILVDIVAGSISYHATNYVTIGSRRRDYSPTSVYETDGTLDSIKLYNRAISAAEVKAIFEEDGGTYATAPVDYLARWTMDNADLYTVVSGQVCTSAPTDYVAYWNMDDASGSFVESVASRNANGIGSPTYGATGRVSDAITFDGVDDYGLIADDAVMKPTEFTISAWVSMASGAYTESPCVFQSSNKTATVHWYQGWFLQLGTDGSVNLIVGDNTGTVFGTNWGYAGTTGIDIRGAGFTLVTGTYDGITIRIYINGVLKGSYSWNALVYGSTNYVSIGVHREDSALYGGDYGFFKGDLDDIKLYNYALTADEVMALYQIPQPTDMVAHWTMDDASGLIQDSTTNYHHATNSGGNPVYSNIGQVGSSIEFLGTSEFFTIPDHADFQSANFTVSSWINADSFVSTMPIFQCFDRLTSVSYGFWVSVLSSAKVNVRFGDGSVDFTDTLGTGTVTANVWSHIAVTYDGANVRIYIDGGLDSTTARTTVIGYRTTGNNKIRVGEYATSQDGTPSHFDGDIDDLKFFNRALDAGEIRNIYEMNGAQYCYTPTTTMVCTTPPVDYVAYWNMDESSGQIQDSSGNGRHSNNIYGSPVYSEQGRIGTSITLASSSSEAFGIANDPILRPTNLTIAVWMKSSTDTTGVASFLFTSFNGEVSSAYGGFRFANSNNIAILTVFDNTGKVYGDDWESAVGTTLVNDGNWHLIVGTYDGINLKVYTDGILEGSQPFSNGIAYHTTNYVAVGAEWNVSSHRNYFNGSLDDIKLYSRAITADEVMALYNAAPPTDMSAWYKMDDVSTQAADSSGNNYTGSENGNPTYGVTGYGDGGTAIDFDGVGDFYLIANQSGLRPANVTVSAWVNLVDNTVHNGIFGANSSNTNRGGYQLIVYNDAQGEGLAFYVSNNTGVSTRGVHYERVYYSDVSIIDSTWHHIVGTHDGSTVKIYLDGVLINSAPYASDIAYESPTTYVRLGCSNATGTNSNFTKGSIDDLKMYPRAISADEVKSLYDLTSSQYCYDPAAQVCTFPPHDYSAYWTCTHDSPTGNYLDEVSGYIGDTAVTQDSIIGGRVGNYAPFNGTTQYWDMPNNTWNKPASVFTISAWYNSDGAAAHNGTIYQSGNWVGTTYNFSGFRLGIGSVSTAYVQVADNSGQVNGTDNATASTTIDIFDDAWHLITGTYDGSELKLYLDGVLQGTTSWVGGIAYIGVNEFYRVGVTSYQSGPVVETNWLDGNLDNIKLWNDRAISADEVAALYNYAPPTDYAAYWNMDEASGNLTDSSTSGIHTATVNGTPVYSVTSDTSLSGTAITFDGSTDYFTVVNHVDLRPASFTLSAWFKKSTSPDGYIFASNTAGLNHDGIIVAIVSDVVRSTVGDSLGISASNQSNLFGTTTVTDGNWHHAVCTYDGATNKVYVDGVLEASEAWANGIGYETPNKVNIGRNETGVSLFEGTLDDIKFYPRAISADEVASIYDSSKYCRNSYFVEPTDYFAYWPMDEASPSDLSELSGNGYNMQAFGSPTYEVTGISDGGTAIDFNGTNDTFDAKYAFEDDFKLNQISFSAWIEPDTTAAQIVFQAYSGTSSLIAGYQFWSNGSMLVGANTGQVKGQTADYESTGSVGVAQNELNFITSTWDGQNLKSYLNGILIITVPFDSGVGHGTTNQVRIGAREITGSGISDYFNGTIDDIKIFDRPLQYSEIQAMYLADAPVSPTDYVAYWTMDEASGLIQDSSGNAHHATTTIGTPVYAATGKVGDAINFDGSTDAFYIPDYAALKPSTITASAWVSNTDVTTARRIVCNAINTNSNTKTWGYVLTIGGDGKGYFLIYDGTNTTAEFAVTPSTINDGNLHLLTGTYDGSTIKIYLDGLLVGSNTVASHLNYSGTHKFRIGCIDVDVVSLTPTLFFKGELDDIKIFNRALTAAEISSMYIADGGT